MMLFGGSTTRVTKPPVAHQAPAYGALRVQSSCYGGVIGVVLGTTRVPGNLIWSDDFEAIEHATTTTSGGGGGGGGKGGGGGGGGGSTSTTTISYTYQVAIAVGLSLGPISGVGQVWSGKTVTSLSALGGTVMEGRAGQSPWGYLQSKHPDQALGYSGLAYVGFGPFELGDVNSLPNLNFEVMGQKDPANGVAGQDTHLDWAVSQVLSASWGAGFPADLIGDCSAFRACCGAHGYFISVGLNEARAANELLSDWVTAAGAEFVWSNGMLRIVPYGEETVSGNGYTYSPDLTPVYDLGPDDFIRASADDAGPLVKVTRRKLADLYNRVKVEYLDRSNGYNIAVETAEDPAHIALYGVREAPVIKAHQIQSAAVARLAADLALARHVNTVTEYEFALGWRHCRLEPMDPVTLTDPEAELDREPARIVEIDEDDTGRLVVRAEEMAAGIALPRARITFQASQSFALDVNVAPGPTSAPLIFEPPAAMTTDGLEVWMAVCGDGAWGGCTIWVSEDGDTYMPVGTVRGRSRMGVLAADLPAGATTDTANRLSVDLAVSRSALASGTTTDAVSLNTLCWVDGELIAYRDADLVGPYRYDLGYLVRGAASTAITAHPAGTGFVRLDGPLFRYPYRVDQAGRTVQIKLQSINYFGGAPLDLSQIEPVAYTITGAPLLAPLPPITGLATSYVSGIITLSWAEVSDFRAPIDYEIRMGIRPEAARVIGRTSMPRTPGWGSGTYWIAAHYKVPNGPDIYSSEWVSVVVEGAQIVKNVITRVDEASVGWPGSMVNAHVVGGEVMIAGGGDLLVEADILSVPDIILYGLADTSGAYTIPIAHRVTLSAPVACPVLLSVDVRGQAVNDDILSEPDVLALTDLTGSLLGVRIVARPQIRLSQDGETWGAWQDWAPGSYLARGYDARVLLSSIDPEVVPVLSGFSLSVDVPDRVVTHRAQLGTGGPTWIAYPGGPFNGGGGLGDAPDPQVTILGAQPGDDLIVTDVTLAGFAASVINAAGQLAAREIAYLTQGF